MHLKHYLLFIFILSIPFLSQAQRWKRYRYEAVFGVGASNFLGELGGANQIGTHFIKDLEIAETKPVFHLGVRYRLSEFLAVKTGFNYGWVSGSDKLTQEPFRLHRDLNFRSCIVEFSSQLEVSWKREQIGHKYKLKGVKGRSNIEIFTYLFAGAGGFYFNPKGQYTDGKYYALQPLGTEGQGIIAGRDPYSLFQFCIPMGIGFKYAIDRKLSITFEISGRKTFTDYIDDVSTSYVDNKLITSIKGEKAGYFADPNRGTKPMVLNGVLPYISTSAGMQRGDRLGTDMYMFAIFSVNYKLRTGRNNLPSF